ncbi:MAG: hypothetical protein RDU76_08360 [Candidatus Edwardsbacteria bacterium]|nr:hypothetical protein [Candidatus Edwardsbacteria bacterium]
MVKNNLLRAAFVLAALTASCAAPVSYLPEQEMIGEENHGAYIVISTHSGKVYAGELIAVGDSVLVVREELDSLAHCFLSPLMDIKSFSLRYANGKNYGWAVPLYTLGSLSHGLFFIFTAPINLIATSVIAVGASQAYEMDSRAMTFEELKLFARFPQGLPEGITPEMIK